MHRPALALALMVLLLPSALGATDPGRRSPDLATTANVNSVAVSDAGTRYAAGTDDAGSSSVGANPDQDVWYLWDEDGAVIQHGSADRATCSSTLGDSCSSSVRKIALSDDGTRLVALSQVSRPATGSQESLLLFATSNAGEGFRVVLDGQPRGLAISANGAQVAVVTENRPTSTSMDTESYVALYDWGTQFAVTEVFHDTLPNPPSDMALSRDGQRLLVATNPGSGAGQVHWYARSDTQTDATVTGLRPTSLAIAPAAPYRAVVGYQTGDLLLFNDGSKQTTTSRLQYGGGATGVSDTAVARSGTQAVVGYSDGTVRLFSIDAATERLSRVGTDPRPSTGSIGHVAFSGDGKLAAVASGTTLALYSVASTGLTELWKTTLGATITSIAMDLKGDHLAVGSGRAVAVFEARRAITATIQSAPTDVAPGTTFKAQVRFENTGNRAESVTLTLGFPSGWFVSATPLQLSLAAGQSAVVEVSGLVPDAAPPGDYMVFLNHTLGHAGLPLKVPLVRDLVIDVPDGPGMDVGSGGSATRQIVVANRGNRVETVRPAVQVGSGWTATVSPAQIPVDPGDEGEFQVTVNAPTGAQQGSSTPVTVTIVGYNGDPARLTATVGAVFGVDVSGPVGLAVPAGQNRTLTFTVENPGNTLDSYDLRLLGGVPDGWSVAFADGGRTGEVEEVAAGGAENVAVIVTAPFDADADLTFPVTLEATSQSDGSQRASEETVVSVGDEDSTTSPTKKGGGKGLPGPAPALLAMALAALAVALRRRGQA